jgi:hypothetical protein
MEHLEHWVWILDGLCLLVLILARLTREVTGFVEELKRLIRAFRPGSDSEGGT